MIKPDLVEVGGDWVYPADEDPSIGVVTANKDFIISSPFVVENGTTFSSAKISNLIAKLWNQFPSASANLIKALIISSCSHPEKFSPRDGQTTFECSSPLCYRPAFDEGKVNAIYGHGRPNIIQASSSDLNRVVLLDESTIKLDSARFYEIPLPNNYYSTRGDRELSVALCFDPRTKRTRGDSYLGCTMEFRLHRGASLSALKAKYTNLDDVKSEEAHLKEISLLPGPQARSKGCTQKGSIILKNPRFSDEKLQLALICRDKWIDDPAYEQKYAVVVRVAHKYSVDLYTPIKSKIDIRLRMRARV